MSRLMEKFRAVVLQGGVKCPECKGTKYVDVDSGRGGTNLGDCPRCLGTGRVEGEPLPKLKPGVLLSSGAFITHEEIEELAAPRTSNARLAKTNEPCKRCPDCGDSCSCFRSHPDTFAYPDVTTSNPSIEHDWETLGAEAMAVLLRCRRCGVQRAKVGSRWADGGDPGSCPSDAPLVCFGCALRHGETFPCEPSVQLRSDGHAFCNDCWTVAKRTYEAKRKRDQRPNDATYERAAFTKDPDAPFAALKDAAIEKLRETAQTWTDLANRMAVMTLTTELRYLRKKVGEQRVDNPTSDLRAAAEEVMAAQWKGEMAVGHALANLGVVLERPAQRTYYPSLAAKIRARMSQEPAFPSVPKAEILAWADELDSAKAEGA